MNKKQGNFELEIKAGEFTNSQIIVMLGQNGTGKTTFINIIKITFSLRIYFVNRKIFCLSN